MADPIGGEITPLAFDEQTTFTAEFFSDDAATKPAKVQGVPVWATSQPDVAIVEPAADGLSCVVKAVQGGDSRISMVADGDMSAGTREITAFADVHVVGAEARIARMSHGPITKQ